VQYTYWFFDVGNCIVVTRLQAFTHHKCSSHINFLIGVFDWREVNLWGVMGICHFVIKD